MNYLRKKRYDYFLIWGNGTQYKQKILNIIRKQKSIHIVKILDHKPKNIAKLVKTIYSYDYAPLQHLKSKTRYLLKTDPDVVFIFVHNQDAQEVYYGQGAFRHLECERIKNVKEKIRNRFNPRHNGKRTEEHVVHASDNESQVHYILKYLGFNQGINLLRNTPNPLLSAPYHLPKFNQFVVKQINVSQLYCSILKGDSKSWRQDIVKIEDTPHYACLVGDKTSYESYLDTFRGTLLTDDHTVEHLIELSQNLIYLEPSYPTAYILTKEFRPGQYLIIDGVHRASILKFKGVNHFPVAVVR